MRSIKAFIQSKTIDELLLGALVFLLPFEYIPSFDILGVSLRLSFIIAAVLIIRALAAVGKAKTLIKDLSVRLLIAFMFWVAITSLVAINIPRAGMVVVFTLFTTVTALSIRVLYKPEYQRTLIGALLWSSLIVAIFGLYQYFGNMAGLSNSLTGIRNQYGWQIFGFPRIHSTALEPLYYCSYLLIPVSYLATYILSKKSVSWRYMALFVLLASSIVLTLSRGGIVALVVLVATAVGLMLIRKRTSIRHIGKLVGLLMLAAGAALMIISTVSREPLNKTITGGEEGAAGYTNQLKKTRLDGSGDDRGVTRQAAIDLIVADPAHAVIGVGPGQFGPHYQDNQPTASGGWKIVNNETLELLAEYGIIGFVLFTAFVLSVLVKAWQSTKTVNNANILTTGLLVYTVALAVQYQTFSTLYIMHVWVVIGLLMALGYSKQQSNE